MQLYAKDIMSEDLITLRPETTCDEASEIFRMNNLSGAPVVDSRGVLLGVISVKDLLSASQGAFYGGDFFSQSLLEQQLSEEGFHFEPSEGFVSDYLTRTVFTALPDTPVEELARLMYQHHVHRIIIVQPHEQKPVGIVSTFDLLKVLADVQSTAELKQERARLSF